MVSIYSQIQFKVKSIFCYKVNKPANLRRETQNSMKEKGSNVNNFWRNFKKAAIESGVNDTVAEWYVN